MHINPYSRRADILIMFVIIVNTLTYCLYAYGIGRDWFIHIDTLCMLFFIAEMYLKMRYRGIRAYWSKGWNIFDGTLVILSLPSLVISFLPVTDLSLLLIFRMLRALRFFRLIHFFPHAEQIGKNCRIALRESFPLFVGYLIVIIIFSLFSTALFGHVSPQYFGTPLDSIYTIFRLFTIEGWYDIPDSLTAVYGAWGVVCVRLYFGALLIVGGIIGLSILNSVFVDAMLNDDHRNLMKRMNDLEKKLDLLLEKYEQQESAVPTENNIPVKPKKRK